MDNEAEQPLNNYNDDHDLGYESEAGYDDVQDDEADEIENTNPKNPPRGITRLFAFRNKYGRPGAQKLKVTFDHMDRLIGDNRSLFSSFLGDIVREQIGLKILSWKKVDQEARDKLWVEIMRYFDVDETHRKVVMIRLGAHLRNFRRKLRESYILPNLNTPAVNEVPIKYSSFVHALEWNSFVEYTSTEDFQV